MILSGEFFAKLTRTVHSRVDLPTQLRLYLSRRRNHIGETYLTRDHEVHIARRLFLASCNRPVHERKANPILKRTERFVKNVSYSRRLSEDAFHLCEDGVLAIRLVVDFYLIYSALVSGVYLDRALVVSTLLTLGLRL